MALVTDTGIANSTQLHLVQFHTLPVPVTRAITPHIALSTVLLTILMACKDEHLLRHMRTQPVDMCSNSHTTKQGW